MLDDQIQLCSVIFFVFDYILFLFIGILFSFGLINKYLFFFYPIVELECKTQSFQHVI
ncbi:hypothetical protein Echvi_3922 [Echinicola vietnamensis DSM 17526]|uniref:Uncharacterized protein n=1 Tax=Echinicola vietnamensis (strain DSM 17526 / LMG 23754 / KMM 6221) TaxID=926556 RepID=L0G3N8_ECHVK|nr:hypothetical protein Echvi_3922 [Echinicola vietnamensis DSM 17526]